MKQFYLLILISVFHLSAVFAQPDRELRAVWFTSVYNIDWPKNNVSASTQKSNLVFILDKLKEANFNAVMFQVRPNADALYKSAYEPWSHWITGVRGQEPTFDPLAYLIEEANKRGMEVHAWLNPYRFENTAGEFSGRPGNYSVTHPELIITVGGKTYFDPGNPTTTKLIQNIVADLVVKYRLDGVIFDDYFYPSNMGESFDQKTYDQWGTKEFVSQWYNVTTTKPSRGDFRRASVNNMIRAVNDTIKKLRPQMVFGVSPAGIYSLDANAASHWGTTLPPGISGRDNYHAINCDPLAWLFDKSVDYISPQLYWRIGGSQDFITLTNWWANEAKRRARHHYPSMASYKLYTTENEPLWEIPEIENQIKANRQATNNLAQGYIYYNTSSVINQTKNLWSALKNDYYSTKTIFPELAWLPSVQEGAPEIAEIGNISGTGNLLAAMNIINTPAERFLLYGKVSGTAKSEFSSGEFMQVIFGKDIAMFYHNNKDKFSIVEYMPNRQLGFGSSETAWLQLASASVTAPTGGTACDNTSFTWTGVTGSESYHVQVARAVDPGTLVFTSQPVTSTSYMLPQGTLNGQDNYVFRVKAKAGASVSWSNQGSFFAGQPVRTILNSPADGAQNVKLSTTFQWNTATAATSYHVQVATDPSFINESIVVDRQPLSMNILTTTLTMHNTKHYARVRSVNTCGYSHWSDVNVFTTEQGTGIELAENHILKAWPNPASQIFNIEYPSMTGSRVIFVFDSQGRLISQEERTDFTLAEQLNVSSLTPGFYLVKIESGAGKRYMARLLKTNK
jgi:uncharacterized lipoprotein YddW (UPF0748 family)